MTSDASALQLETYHGVIADALASMAPEVVRGVPSEFVFSASNYSFVPLGPEVARSVQAELYFPLFGFSLPAVVEPAWSADEQSLTLRIETDEGVTLTGQLKINPTDNGDELPLEETWKIDVISPRPRSYFVASTLLSLLMLDEQSLLRADRPKFSLNIHFADSVKTVSEYLQRRQIAYRLMVIEKAFHQEFSIPQFISSVERSTVDFVYGSVTDRSFAWPFWQESYPFLANEQARKLLMEMNGVDSFVIEIGCLQQILLGRVLNLGEVKVTVQNAALVNTEEVNRELQRLDGHRFEALIKSLSGAATYEFAAPPRLPESPWDERIKPIIELEDKLDERFFQSVNQLAAASLAGLTEREKAAVTEPFTLSEAAFADPGAEVKD